MKKHSNYVFQGLHIVAWIIFVGLCVEAGAQLFNFIYSMFKPVVAGHLYEQLNLSELYARNKGAYVGIYSFVLVISFLKAYLFYIVIKLLSQLDLTKPFSLFVAEKITLLSYYTLSIGLLSYIARATARGLEHHGLNTDRLEKFWADSQAFILMAAVIYVISVIFARGVELQEENDLTV